MKKRSSQLMMTNVQSLIQIILSIITILLSLIVFRIFLIFPQYEFLKYSLKEVVLVNESNYYRKRQKLCHIFCPVWQPMIVIYQNFKEDKTKSKITGIYQKRSPIKCSVSEYKLKTMCCFKKSSEYEMLQKSKLEIQVESNPKEIKMASKFGIALNFCFYVHYDEESVFHKGKMDAKTFTRGLLHDVKQ